MLDIFEAMASKTGPYTEHDLIDHDEFLADDKHTSKLLKKEGNSDVLADQPQKSYCFADRDSLVHDDSTKTTNGEECKENNLFMTIARKKSVVITVDRWSSDPATVKETLPREIIYAVADKTGNPHLLESKEDDSNAIYSVVNKSSKTPLQNSLENEPNYEAYYGKVNKVTKTAKQNDCLKDSAHFSKVRFQPPDDYDDIGTSDDLQNDDEDHRRRKETLYAYVGGKVMVVSDEGDYASVDTLSDSDVSKSSETTRDSMVSLEHQAVGKKCHDSESALNSENGLNKQWSRYALQYLGSLPLDEKDLLPQSCNQVVGQCIVKMVQQSSQNPAMGLTHEWPKDAKMIMEISESKQSLKLLNSSSREIYDDHYLYLIRIWAVGKETNGKYFAYVIRSKSLHHHVCRVFLCEVAARHIADTIRNICQSLAARNNKKAADLSQSSAVGSVSSSGTKAERNGSSESLFKPSGAALMKAAIAQPTVITCSYLGVVPSANASGKETVNAVTKTVFTSTSKDNWKAVSIQLSPTSINIKDTANSAGNRISLPVDIITDIGSSTKNKNLAAILTKGNDDGISAHVFYCEQSAKELVQKVQAVCKLSPSITELRPKSSVEETQRNKGLVRLFQGKQKAK